MDSAKLMRAIRIHEYGGQHTLVEEQVTLPFVDADDVLIAVQNTSVNPVSIQWIGKCEKVG
ncbi:hypothetical protein ACFOEE_18030 [Pseudoalteromonas fenneropenaei]|uniref:Uncharacterized protein n=1 Tax=Pseudoalteromonas fenneropenaei TaxID=1737459 RepID=A0ABV7CNZ1_9GAMM